MVSPRKNARTTRGRPFPVGNPGRPPGARHKVTLAVEALLDGEGEALTRKAIALAMKGNVVALKICLDRICPPRGRTVQIALPSIATPGDIVGALGAIVGAVSGGTLSPDEGAAMASIVNYQKGALELVELEARVARLEQMDANK